MKPTQPLAIRCYCELLQSNMNYYCPMSTNNQAWQFGIIWTQLLTTASILV